MDTRSLLEQAVAHREAGRARDAEMLLRQILAFEPANLPALGELAMVCRRDERHAESEALLRTLLAHAPGNAFAWAQLGLTLGMQEKFEPCIDALNRSVELDPNQPETWDNLSNALRQVRRLAESEQAARRSMALAPSNAFACLNLADALAAQHQYDEAIAAYEKAIALAPMLAPAYLNLGVLLGRRGRRDTSLAMLRRAVELAPDNPRAQGALSERLRESGLLQGAIDSAQRAVELAPRLAEARSALAGALTRQGRAAEAIPHCRAAIELAPNKSNLYSDLLLTLHYTCTDPAALFEEHLSYARRFAPVPLPRPEVSDREPNRRLRIGFVSPDFRRHSVAWFFEPILASLGREKFETFCYASLPLADDVTDRLRRLSAHWRDIYPMTDAEAIELIRADRIDILVDLAGHSGDTRLPIFIVRPAPIQVTYLGYAATTGLAAMDFKITDALADPPGKADALYTERLIRLPQTAWCYRPPADAPAPAPRSGAITFGSFNILAKLTDDMIDAWSRILGSVAGSSLLLKNPAFADPATQQRITRMFEAHGVPGSRLRLYGANRRHADHLATCKQVDIALDTSPYHGTTTTCEMLFMGVPVITLAGKAHVSRVGVSLLTNVGLSELIAQSKDEYIELAIELAEDRGRIAALRAGLRGRLLASPLADAPAFTRAFEEALRKCWVDHIRP